MANAVGECNACEGGQTIQSSLISEPNLPISEPKPISQPDLPCCGPELGSSLPEEAERLSARLAVLDPAFAGTADPGRVVIEIANDFPDVRGWKMVLQ
jgi:hypothetical protein